MNYTITVNKDDNIYSEFINNILKISLNKNHTCNTLKELKYIFLKLNLKEYNIIKDSSIDLYNLSFNIVLNEDTFKDFVNTIPSNHYALYNEETQEMNTYLNFDHFLQSDYDLGKVIRMNTDDGIKDFINDDLELTIPFYLRFLVES